MEAGLPPPRRSAGCLPCGISAADPASEPRAICARDDGVWFTEREASKIGHIHLDGRLEEFPLPAGAAPLGITAGRDGALWFTETGTDRIGRMTASGALSEFALAAGSLPSSIVSGPDGNVWFTETGRDRIGRVTVEAPCAPDGQTLCLNGGRFRVLAFWGVSVQGASGEANGIALTGDTGAFWFFSANNVELVVKVVDGRAVNGHFWVFGAGLTDVEDTRRLAAPQCRRPADEFRRRLVLLRAGPRDFRRRADIGASGFRALQFVSLVQDVRLVNH